MKPQYFHSLTTSFYLWLDNLIQSKGETYTEQSNQILKEYSDPTLPNIKAYGSNFQQWVYNSDLNLTVPTTAIINGVSKSRNDGVIFDFKKGRILIDQNVNDSPVNEVKASFYGKTFNIYLTEDSAEILIEKAFSSLNRVGNAPSYADPQAYISPAVFIQIDPSENKPSSFGGEMKSSSTFRVIFISDNNYFVQGLLSIFNDAAQKCFPLITDFGLVPFNFYGDLKNQFSYKSLNQQVLGKIMVENVYSSGINQATDKQKSLNIAYSEFDLICHRFKP